MKGFWIFVVLVFGFMNVKAQNLNVTYLELNNHPENDKQYSWKLDYKNGKSIYTPIDEISDFEKEITLDIQGEQITTLAQVHQNFNITYIDYKEKKQIVQARYKGADYLISESLPNYKWEILDESKSIGKYNCKAAKRVNDEGYEIKVWFSEELPVSSGPYGQWGLPGLILELRVGFKHIIVKEVNFNKVSEIHPPTQGTVVTRENYNSEIAHIDTKSSTKTTVTQEGNTTVTTTRVREVKSTEGPKKQ